MATKRPRISMAVKRRAVALAEEMTNKAAIEQAAAEEGVEVRASWLKFPAQVLQSWRKQVAAKGARAEAAAAPTVVRKRAGDEPKAIAALATEPSAAAAEPVADTASAGTGAAADDTVPREVERARAEGIAGPRADVEVPAGAPDDDSVVARYSEDEPFDPRKGPPPAAKGKRAGKQARDGDTGPTIVRREARTRRATGPGAQTASTRRVDDAMHFFDHSPTPFHAVREAMARLNASGFEHRDPRGGLDANPGDRFYCVHPDLKTILAFVIGRRPPTETGFAIVGTHVDSPDLRLRLNPFKSAHGTHQITTQIHGGVIYRSWLDRPLGIAGVVYHLARDAQGQVRFHPITEEPLLERELVHVDGPVCVIPEVAIHLDREKNKVGEVNPQTHLNAVFATSGVLDDALSALAAQAGVDVAGADAFDLHLVPTHKAARVGVDGSMLMSPRLDNLAMSWAALQGLIESVQRDSDPGRTRCVALFDAEETGSRTASGADSSFLRDTLLRIARRHPEAQGAHDAEQALGRSFVVSADGAHAVHPNHADKHDEDHRPTLGAGLVLKVNTNDRYATTGEGVAAFKAICESARVPLQGFVSRQDMACGSTIGAITAAQLGARTLDVGAPMWAMHSTYETMGTVDLEYSADAFRAFFLGRGAR